jgi:2'-5' RNA ligase
LPSAKPASPPDFFPVPDGGDVWWAGIKESKLLIALQNDLTNNLIDAGFMLDKRKYSPHITLGRQILTDVSASQVEFFGETVDCIELMKSERINGKLTYAAIHGRRAYGAT